MAKKSVKKGSKYPKASNKRRKRRDRRVEISTQKKHPTRDDTATVIANVLGYTPRYVRMVMNGESENDDILTAAITYKEGKNRLLQEVKKLVPFN